MPSVNVPAIAPRQTKRTRRFDRFRSTRTWRWGRWPLGALALLGGAALALTAYLYVTVELPPAPPTLQSSVVLDAKGRPLAILAKDGVRQRVTLKNISPAVPKALVAAEDRNFYENSGIDPRGLVRAFVNNAKGQPLQGGSTITQQLVKNSYLTPERSYSRKVKEGILAIKLDRSMDKDEILERYLNTVYFGRGAYGIQTASDAYFGTKASKLTYPQAALLIGLLRAPESADPTTDPETAKARRDSVLDDLAEVGDLTRAEARAFQRTELGAKRESSIVTLRAGVGAHAVEWIRQEAVKRFGAEVVYGQGLRIHSTIDIDKQRAAEDAVRQVLDQPTDPEAALVALDSKGGVKAEVGGRDFQRLKVDLARGDAGGGGGRQPGSSFKPLVLATAIDSGTATLGSRYSGPPSLTLDTAAGPWTVGNFGGESFGQIDLTTATAHSVNTTYAQLMLQADPNRVVETAKRLGVRTPLAPNPSLVLGTSEVSVVDIATAYSTFGRDGRRIDAHIIGRVQDADKRTIYEFTTGSGEQVIKPGTARAVNHALQEVVRDGTATAARLDRPAAGKTGTTQDYGDAWFAGYTPDFTAVVWMGYPEGPAHRMDDVRGRSVTGGSFPAEIWKRFMEAALAGVPEKDFPDVPPALLRPPTGRPLPAPAGTRSATTAPREGSTTSTPVTTTEAGTPTTAPPPTTTPVPTTAAPPPPPPTTTTEPPAPTTTVAPGGVPASGP
ncbi:transglycosylase domain-containing protein [Aquihabitans daechungensis]|uniref:transglycosylase domain-containing protein n=1 Tax=Aquihabitans daechungensis TaxID=1052257 RepID=UPI003BA1422C